METFISVRNGVKGIRASAAEPGAPASEAGRGGLASGSPPPPFSPPGPGALSLPALGRGAQDASLTLPVSRFSFLSAQRAGGPETFSFRSPPFVWPLRGERTPVRRGCLRPAAARGGRSRVNVSLIPEISGALVNESYIF